MKERKIMEFNIVTFHTAYNQGAVLQTLALQEFIKENGYSVGVYDYRPPYIPPFQGAKGKIFKILRKIHEKEYIEKEKKFQEFVNTNLNVNLEQDSKIYLSGSDQVWNPTGSMNPIYFLQFVSDKSVRASYAASMGKTVVPKMKEELFEKYIKRFDCFSVREADVKECISKYTSKDISVNVDPTLLMNADFWEKYMREVPNMPDDFILAYILHLPKNANKLLKWLQKETGAKIVLIDGQGAMTHLVHNDISLHNVGPREFLWLMKHSKAVVTSSFHGTAFSLIFHKEFYSIVNPAAPSRINNILNIVGLNSVKETDTVDDFSRNINIDWNSVSKILDTERLKSLRYIKSVYNFSNENFREAIKGTVESVRNNCTGCSACEASCPVDAIKMHLNSEGFFEPKVDKEKCINCSKCIRTCPIDKKVGRRKQKSYYGWHKDPNVRFNSSSGGAFRALADKILQEGGVVYGAVYSNDWRSVEFSNSDNTDMEKIQKSKYTVSNPSGIYYSIKNELDLGRKVLFCGTPCQNAGLSSYLNKEYDNLIRCDFVCGGMASLTFYQEYLDYLSKKFQSEICFVDFRPKYKGWGKQRIKVKFRNNKEYTKRSHLDYYFKCFANEHVSVRSTCLDCEYYAYHVSDITLADFWGYKIAKIKKNKEGLSLIMTNTNKGDNFLKQCDNLNAYVLDSKYSDYAVRSKSPNLKKINQRNIFFEKAHQKGFIKASEELYKVDELSHIKAYVKSKLKL